MLKKARKHKSGGYENILDRWHKDDKYRKSLSDIGWAEEQNIEYDVAFEDHSYVATRSYVATWQEGSLNGQSWKHSLNAEGIQGPMYQRSDFIEAKQTAKDCITNIQQSLEVGTNLSLQG